jgi:hypothetical protein
VEVELVLRIMEVVEVECCEEWRLRRLGIVEVGCCRG